MLTVCHEIACPLKLASTGKPHSFWKLHINLVVSYEASTNYLVFCRAFVPVELCNVAALVQVALAVQG